MKLKFIALLLCLPFFSSSQSITDSLLLYYPMNGNANDLSGNNFHGTPSGVTSVPDRYGVPNSAYYFDGVNDYIDFPLNDTLKPEFPMTFAFWAKLKELSVYKNRFFNTDFVQNNYHGVWMNTNNSGYLGIGFGGGMFGCNPQNRISYNATELPLDTGIWYHLTGVIKSANDMELYVNCNTVAAVYSSGAQLTNVVYSNNIAGTIGRADANNAPMYNWGFMDEFSYWERALSATEVYTLCDSMPLITTTTTWDCVNGACIDPGNGTGIYTTYSDCQNICKPTALNEFGLSENKVLLRVVNVLGEEVNEKEYGLLFYIYDDGSVVKQVKIK